MSDDIVYSKTKEFSEVVVVKSDIIESHGHGDVGLEKVVSGIVTDVIQADMRLSDTPETREALRDYVRMEIILAMKFKNAIKKPGSISSADERMIRSAVKMKMDIRQEVYKDVKGDPGKEREVGEVRELVAKKVIKAGKGVDPLGSDTV
jgi:hypothetical protein